MVWDWRVSRAEPMLSCWQDLLFLFCLLLFYLLLPSMGWLCGVGVFELIECPHSLPALHCGLQIIIIVIIIIITVSSYCILCVLQCDSLPPEYEIVFPVAAPPPAYSSLNLAWHQSQESLLQDSATNTDDSTPHLQLLIQEPEYQMQKSLLQDSATNTDDSTPHLQLLIQEPEYQMQHSEYHLQPLEVQCNCQQDNDLQQSLLTDESALLPLLNQTDEPALLPLLNQSNEFVRVLPEIKFITDNNTEQNDTRLKLLMNDDTNEIIVDVITEKEGNDDKYNSSFIISTSPDSNSQLDSVRSDSDNLRKTNCNNSISILLKSNIHSVSPLNNYSDTVNCGSSFVSHETGATAAAAAMAANSVRIPSGGELSDRTASTHTLPRLKRSSQDVGWLFSNCTSLLHLADNLQSEISNNVGVTISTDSGIQTFPCMSHKIQKFNISSDVFRNNHLAIDLQTDSAIGSFLNISEGEQIL